MKKYYHMESFIINYPKKKILGEQIYVKPKFKRLLSSWSYGSWIYNYLCNQCLSSLKLWVLIMLRRGVLDTTLYDKVCQWLATGQTKPLWVLRFPPPIKLTDNNWNTVERGVKHHNPSSLSLNYECWFILYSLTSFLIYSLGYSKFQRRWRRFPLPYYCWWEERISCTDGYAGSCRKRQERTTTNL
jgi:hypothetical protein